MRIPKAAKVEKATSQDVTERLLFNPYLEVGDDGSGRLLISDKHSVVIVPVEDCENDTDGPVPLDAIKLSRKHGELVKLDRDYATIPGAAAFPRESQYTAFPPVDQLLVEKEDAVREVGINVKTLWNLCQAMGCEVVKLRIVENEQSPIGVVPHVSETHIHGSEAAILPYVLKRSV